MSADVQPQQTSDGSPTLYSRAYDQTYHNPGGAVSESRHVFFEQSGLRSDLKEGKPITVLETGFGTGLNLLLLLDLWLTFNYGQPVAYHSIEADPISPDIAESLNYDNFLKHADQLDFLPQLLSDLKAGFNNKSLFQNVRFSLYIGPFRNYPDRQVQADYIFHDAFSPDVNPELWRGDTFRKLWSNCSDTAILTTYCAASRARGAMSWAGWTVGQAPGALGKREMTIASPDSAVLEEMGVDLVNNERLAHRYEIGDFD